MNDVTASSCPKEVPVARLGQHAPSLLPSWTACLHHNECCLPVLGVFLSFILAFGGCKTSMFFFTTTPRFGKVTCFVKGPRLGMSVCV